MDNSSNNNSNVIISRDKSRDRSKEKLLRI